jgi:hypothetical protein
MAIDLGTAPLQTAVEGGLGEQQKNLDQQRINQQATQHAGQPLQDAASGVLQKELNKITITPQLASGYSELTGDDSAMRMVGMKMDPSIWSAMLANGVQKKVREEGFETQKSVAETREKGQENVESTRAKAGEAEAKTRAGAEVESAKIRADAATKAANIKASAPSKAAAAKLSPADAEFVKTYRQYQKDIPKEEGTFFDDDSTKKKKQFLQDNESRFDKIMGISGDDDNKQAALDYLKKNHPELKKPTDQDIKWAQDQLNK